MIPENFDPIQAGIVLSGGILALAAVIALYRVVFGPTAADRVIAVDLLTNLLANDLILSTHYDLPDGPGTA